MASAAGCPICSTCNCGRHHCKPSAHGPPHVHGGHHDAPVSSKTMDYAPPPAGYTRAAPIKPQQKPVDSGPFQGQSSYYADYPPKEAPLERRRASHEYKPSSAPFEGNTVAREAFAAPPMVKTESCKPKQRAYKAAGPTDYTTTKGEYGNFGAVERVQPIKPAERPRELAPFEGTSSYQNEFVGKSAERMQPAKPKAAPVSHKSAPPTDYTTSTRGDYVAKPIQKVESCKPKQQARSGGEFDGTTTAQMAYQGQPAERRQAMRPPQQRAAPPPFEATTTAQEAYTGKPTSPVQSKKPDNSYKPSNAPFVGTTSKQDDYCAHDVAASRVQPIKPKQTTHRAPSDPDQFRTTYQKDLALPSIPGARAEPCRPKERRMEQAPFEGTTEAQDNFVAKPINRTQPIKPKQNRSNADIPPMETYTTAQQAYTAHDLGCPAARKPQNLWRLMSPGGCAHCNSRGGCSH